MVRQHIATVITVFVAAIAATAFYEFVLERSRGYTGVRWELVAEGVLIGATTSAVWLAARNRWAATCGLGIVALLIVFGLATKLPPGLAFVQSPMAWAVALILGVRLILTESVTVPPREKSPTPRG